jgi:hypothetical protein
VDATTSGNAITDITIPAVKNDWPVTDPFSALWERKPRKPCENTSSPNRASTTLGAPATISIADSTARASHAGRAYSDSHAAMPTPIGAAITVPIADTIKVPTIGSLKPPLCDWFSDGAGEVTNMLRRRKDRPSTAMNTTIPTATRNRPAPVTQHSQ